VFATLHPVSGFAQWACFAGTGVAYGWIRVKSESTIPSILMHTAYNATLYVYQIL
jgi:membrane protease YdiL (CAAX protease family)